MRDGKHLLAAAALLAEHAPDWLSTEGRRVHEAELARIKDRSNCLNANYAALQEGAMQHAFGGPKQHSGCWRGGGTPQGGAGFSRGQTPARDGGGPKVGSIGDVQARPHTIRPEIFSD